MRRLPDAAGHFGRFGGRFVPETLMAPLLELEAAYARARKDRHFQTREERAASPALVSDVGDFIASLKAPLRAGPARDR